MTDPRQLTIRDFTYSLPEHRIAPYPEPERDGSKLLVYEKGHLSQDIFRNLASHLSPSLVVFNNSRVIEARILFQKPTGATIEIFCLEPEAAFGDIPHALAATGSVQWKCLVGNAASWRPNLVLEKKAPDGTMLRAEMKIKKNDYFLIEFSWTPPHLNFREILHTVGLMPLPPYIKRRPEEADERRYQTVYAEASGSVAAPTAGLHFTPQVLLDLTRRGINQDFVTLHVGAGTFKPVKADTMAHHEMHAEFIEVRAALLKNLLAAHNQQIVAVGTTSLRCLESIYFIGAKLVADKNREADELAVTQWEPYETRQEVPLREALNALLAWMEERDMETFVTRTSLLIAPPYTFRVVHVLITNFHQPESTLLLLVAAFIGEDWKKLYAYALENDFRFLSYGDSCLLFRH